MKAFVGHTASNLRCPTYFFAVKQSMNFFTKGDLQIGGIQGVKPGGCPARTG